MSAGEVLSDSRAALRASVSAEEGAPGRLGRSAPGWSGRPPRSAPRRPAPPKALKRPVSASRCLASTFSSSGSMTAHSSSLAFREVFKNSLIRWRNCSMRSWLDAPGAAGAAGAAGGGASLGVAEGAGSCARADAARAARARAATRDVQWVIFIGCWGFTCKMG